MSTESKQAAEPLAAPPLPHIWEQYVGSNHALMTVQLHIEPQRGPCRMS